MRISSSFNLEASPPLQKSGHGASNLPLPVRSLTVYVVPGIPPSGAPAFGSLTSGL